RGRARPRSARRLRPAGQRGSWSTQPPAVDGGEEQREPGEARAEEEGGPRGAGDRRLDRAGELVARGREGRVVAGAVSVERLREVRCLTRLGSRERRAQVECDRNLLVEADRRVE